MAALEELFLQVPLIVEQPFGDKGSFVVGFCLQILACCLSPVKGWSTLALGRAWYLFLSGLCMHSLLGRDALICCQSYFVGGVQLAGETRDSGSSDVTGGSATCPILMICGWWGGSEPSNMAGRLVEAGGPGDHIALGIGLWHQGGPLCGGSVSGSGPVRRKASNYQS